MWYIWYFSGFFGNRYVHCPVIPLFATNIAARRAAAKLRADVYLSYIVLPY